MKNIKFLSLLGLSLAIATIISLGSTSSASAACVDNVYRKGSSGTCVRYIQTLNNAYAPSYANKLTVDGGFGTRTNSSIRLLQSNFGLKSDGIVGYKTWHLLCTSQAGWTDGNGIKNMYVPTGWPLSTAKNAGCSKYWRGSIVAGVRY